MKSWSAESRAELDAVVADLASGFADAGHRIFLVGGVVRDLLLDRGVGNDVDITTDALPDRIRVLLAPLADSLWDQGARFGTIGARIGDTLVEVTTHRAERYHVDSRKPEVDFSTAVEDDLSRRDFTVNAMAIELPEWELIDPFAGQADLAGGVLQTPIDPAASFTDDPLRMLRAARFSAGYGLDPTDALRDAMTTYADRLDIVSRERIAEEMRKLWSIASPGPGLRLLWTTGVLHRILPTAGQNAPIPPSISVDGIELLTLDATRPDAALRWATLLYVLGGDLPTPQRGSEVMASIRESARFGREVTSILHAAQVLERGRISSRPIARRTIVDAGPALYAGYELLDAVDRPPEPGEWELIEAVLAEEGRASLRPALDGSEVVEVLGAEGPNVGRALRFLLDLRLEEGIIDPEVARQRLEKWASDAGL